MELRNIALSLVNLFTGLVGVFLALRFVLKLFGANAANGFVEWIYDTSSVLLAPFRGIFPTEVIDRQYVLEFNTLFALVIYALIGMLLIMFVNMMTPAETVTDRPARKTARRR